MDKTISWRSLDDKERTRLVMVHVLGCTESTNLLVVPRPVERPLACWVEHLECWFLEDGIRHKQFNPLHDMDDAWIIVEKMVARLDSYDNIGFEWMGPLYKSKLNYFSSTQHIPGQVITGHMDYTKDGGFRLGEPCWYVKYADKRYWWIMTDTPQEAIIIAALRIEGVEVLP